MRDVVYFVTDQKQLANNGEELRLSLRSLVNLPHRRVFILGGCPPWVAGVTHVPFASHPAGKWLTLTMKACWTALNNDLTEVVYLMGDDFYVTKPVLDLAPMWTNTLRRRISVISQERSPGSQYLHVFRNTAELVGGDGPNCQLHVPQVLERAALPVLDLIAQGRPVGAASVAAARGTLPTVQVPRDWKVKTPAQLDEWRQSGWPFLSGSDETFQGSGIRDLLHDLFPRSGPYERRP